MRIDENEYYKLNDEKLESQEKGNIQYYSTITSENNSINKYKNINDYIVQQKKDFGVPENETFKDATYVIYEEPKYYAAPPTLEKMSVNLDKAKEGNLRKNIRDLSSPDNVSRLDSDKLSEPPQRTHIDIFNLGTASGSLPRLFDMSGPDYKYNRGIILINEAGRIEEEVLDRTRNHHADRLAEIATNRFEKNVPYQGPGTEFPEAIAAATQGLVTMLLEGKNCIMFIPDDLTVEAINSIMEEVEPRKNFVFAVSKVDGTFAEKITCDMLMDYLQGLKEEKEQEQSNSVDNQEIPEDNDDKMSINEYINILLKYLNEHSLTLIDYYRGIGQLYREGNFDSIPDFEQKNPFIDENDIRLLINSEEDKIVEYFARAMFKVINLNVAEDHKIGVKIAGEYTGHPSIGEKKPLLPEEVTEETPTPPEEDNNSIIEAEEPKSLAIYSDEPNVLAQIPDESENNLINREEIREEIDSMINQVEEEYTDISFESLDNLDGYAVLRDEDEINIYTYNHDDKSRLMNRVTYSSAEYNLKSGYYVNLKESLNTLIGSSDSAVFVNESEEEFTIDSIYTSIETYCLEQGAIKLQIGDEYTDDIYVNKRDLNKFLMNFRIKTTKENINSSQEKGL